MVKRYPSSLLLSWGLKPIDVGPLTEARLLEPLAMLWIKLAHVYGQGRDIAFALLRRQS